MATPKTTREILDGNLTRVVPSGIFNRKVLILGTSLDGPMHSPVQITSPDDAATKFGAFGSGTLVRGIRECFDAQNGFPKTPDVWGMRIGKVKAARAQGTLKDANSNNLLVIEALNEGKKYNDIDVKFDSGKIKIYNPATGLVSSFTYDFDNWDNIDASIHTLDELAAAINADTNLNGAMDASVFDYSASVEFKLDTADAGVVSASAGETVINFSNIATGDVDGGGKLFLSGIDNDAWDGSTADLDATQSPLRDIESFWSINTSGVTEVPKGEGSIKVEGGLAQGNASVFPITDITNSGGYVNDGATSEGYWKVRAAQCLFEQSDGSWSEEMSTMTAGSTFTIKLNVGADVAGASSAAGAIGLDNTKWDASGDVSSSGSNFIKLNFTNSSSGNASFFVSDAGASFDSTFTPAAGTTPAYLSMVVDVDDVWDESQVGPIKAYASFDTEIVSLSKKSLLSSANLATDYFARGNEIIFGAYQPHILAFRYGKVQFYEEGSTLVVTDGYNGLVTLTGPVQPGIEGGALGATATAVIGMSFKYYKGNATTDTMALKGGLDGVNLTNSDLYDDLDTAYESLNQDFFDIFTVMNATFDATKNGYTPTTGVPVVTNAGFADQMSKFLNAFNGELIGVMGFEALKGGGVGGRILKEDIRDRVQYVTTPAAISDPLRPANLLSSFHQPWMYAADLEAIFNYKGNRYGANASAAIAGLIAAMPTEEAIYRFQIPGVQGMVWRYDNVDVASGDQQVDILANNRIAVGVVEGNSVKLSESRSLARAGSDFENIMTVLILQEVLEICRSTAKNYIGKVSSAQLLQAFQGELNKRIGDTMVPRVLRGFKAPVEMTPGERVVGKLTIPLTLSPQFELRDVHYVVQLTAEEITTA